MWEQRCSIDPGVGNQCPALNTSWVAVDDWIAQFGNMLFGPPSVADITTVWVVSTTITLLFLTPVMVGRVIDLTMMASGINSR